MADKMAMKLGQRMLKKRLASKQSKQGEQGRQGRQDKQANQPQAVSSAATESNSDLANVDLGQRFLTPLHLRERVWKEAKKEKGCSVLHGARHSSKRRRDPPHGHA